MIPICLNLRNFMSYTDVHEPLRFEGIHVAVLAGDNGHGKSALLDAITWALWGRSRARGEDDLIHTGATDMEVEFEFALGDEQYRVVRKRQKRGKTSIPDLQFAVRSNGAYRPLTERSVRETEKAIERTLRMSYDTFVSSSFIQQGRADAFTTNLPSERKRVLAEILELGAYDELEAAAREALRVRGQQLVEEQTRSKEWQQEAASRPEIQAEVDRLKEALAELEERSRALESACNLARERVARLEATHRALQEVEERLKRQTELRAATQRALAQTEARLAEASAVLDRAAEIERAAAELAVARRALAEQERQQQLYLPLANARKDATAEISKEKARLEGNLTGLLRQLTELKRLVVDRSQLERDRVALAVEVEALGGAQAERERLRLQDQRCREERAEKRTLNRQLKQQMLELKQRMDALAELQTCPACQRSLDASHKASLRAGYEAEGKTLAAEFRTNEKLCKDLDAAVDGYVETLRALDARLARRDPAQQALVEAQERLRQAEEAQGRLDALQVEIAELETILEHTRYAPEARQRLVEAEAALAKLAYDEAAHARLREHVGTLAATEADSQRLATARVAAEHLEPQRRAHAATLARLDEEIGAEQQRAARLRIEQQSLDADRAGLRQVEADLAAARTERDRARERHIQALGALDHTFFAEKRLNESLAKQDRLRREQGIYAELVTAFGKRGVQAMIIQTAIPEIEQEANAILARMTDGRMHVRLETQRDARTGGGTIETLDIRIADELGTRSYEMFSGGESFRVNFAIRIALSKLLARRAGTRLQTLVVDEGFGSQDAEGRDRIVEAIQAIQSDFEKILVITHLEDLRERFPVRIEVRKTSQGSTISLR